MRQSRGREEGEAKSLQTGRRKMIIMMMIMVMVEKEKGTRKGEGKRRRKKENDKEADHVCILAVYSEELVQQVSHLERYRIQQKMAKYHT